MPLNTEVPSAWRISSPRAFSNQERHHTQDKGEGGHEDRSQAQATRLNDGADAVLTAFLGGTRELDNEDSVLAGQAHQHDKADLRQDVIVQTAQTDAGNGTEQTHRHDQDDR